MPQPGLIVLRTELRPGDVARIVAFHGAVYARAAGNARIILWTESVLTAAARLYHAAGFELAEQRRGRRWGADVVEERYELLLANPDRR